MTIVYVIVGIALGGLVMWLILRSLGVRDAKSVEGQGTTESLMMLQGQMAELVRTMDEKLGRNQKEMSEAVRTQFGESQKLIKDITEQITSVKETNRNVVNVAEQLRSLQNVLQNPKQRGVLGEYYLETVLKNVMPPGSFELQYKFADGEIVDAVIRLDRGKLLPVDSKFSLENYNRIIDENDPTERERLEKLFKQDLKSRIDETAKYIRPAENTMDFAFMFIPSEAIYYDLLINKIGAVKIVTKDLVEYAFRDKKVIIVSPTSFMAYLQTVMQGLRALQIEESAKQIQKQVGELGRHVATYESHMQGLGKSIGTTVNHYNKAYKELGKINKDVTRVTGENPGIEPEMLDGPVLD